MQKFLTEYTLGVGVRFGSYLWAHDYDDAAYIADRRGAGEIVLGTTDAVSSVIPQPGDPGFCHWLMYVAWHAVKFGKDAASLFQDDGVIHEMMHLHEGVPVVGDDPTGEYMALLRELRLIPSL